MLTREPPPIDGGRMSPLLVDWRRATVSQLQSRTFDHCRRCHIYVTVTDQSDAARSDKRHLLASKPCKPEVSQHRPHTTLIHRHPLPGPRIDRRCTACAPARYRPGRVEFDQDRCRPRLKIWATPLKMSSTRRRSGKCSPHPPPYRPRR